MKNEVLIPSSSPLASKYSLLNISTNRKNSDKSSGPKMMPMNPKRDKPITTPKTVISG